MKFKKTYTFNLCIRTTRASIFTASVFTAFHIVIYLLSLSLKRSIFKSKSQFLKDVKDCILSFLLSSSLLSLRAAASAVCVCWTSNDLTHTHIHGTKSQHTLKHTKRISTTAAAVLLLCVWPPDQSHTHYPHLQFRSLTTRFNWNRNFYRLSFKLRRGDFV